jgi:uncharacterized repeat protein (TIGR03803 family)
MKRFNWGIKACGVLLLWATAAIALPAQTTTGVPPTQTTTVAPTVTFTTLHNFNGTDGELPYAGLVQGTDGNFYGTTHQGGANGGGTVFKVTPGGILTAIYSFCSQSNCTDGWGPDAALVQGTDGKFYGTTAFGANSCQQDGGCGTVFKITPGGTLTTLYRFCPISPCTDGSLPVAGLVQGTNGKFYGTTYYGGANDVGTVFKITPGGTVTTLHSFDKTDGAYPYAGLVQGTDGKFYGTTYQGGANGLDGTVFKITPSGTLTTLHNFNGTDGALPEGALVQGTNGNFYGTTEEGGANGAYGTVFKITPSGTLTTLYNFCSQGSCTDGYTIYAALVQGTDGNFYGTTEQGGASNACNGSCGTVFRITPSGTLTTLHSFDNTDGASPFAALVQGTDGKFYGTTGAGGNKNACELGCGTVFSLSVGLGPFVETNPASGTVGSAVKILGTNLTGATAVTFNGTAATFTVKSKFEITTTVPTGATTGTVQVVMPGGTLSSNVPFQVK